MDRKNILTFSWPQEDKRDILFVHVLCTVPAPSLCGRSEQQYKLQHAVTDIIHKIFLQKNQTKPLALQTWWVQATVNTVP
jgi:hypothetical protein